MDTAQKLEIFEKNFGISSLGHRDTVTCLGISNSRGLLASGSLDSTIKVWNLFKGVLEFSLDAGLGAVWSLLFSPDDRYLVSGMFEKVIVIWDLQTRCICKVLSGHTGCINALALYSWKILVSGSDDSRVFVWDLNNFQLLAQLTAHTNMITSICMSTKALCFASGSVDKSVIFWDLKDLKNFKVLVQHKALVNSVIFVNDPEFVASCSEDGSVNLINLKTGSVNSINVFVEAEGKVYGIKSIYYEKINTGSVIYCYSQTEGWKKVDIEKWIKNGNSYMGYELISNSDFAFDHIKRNCAVIIFGDNKIFFGKYDGSIEIISLLFNRFGEKSIFYSIQNISCIALNLKSLYAGICYLDGSIHLLDCMCKRFEVYSKVYKSKIVSLSFSRSLKYLISSSTKISVMVIKILK